LRYFQDNSLNLGGIGGNAELQISLGVSTNLWRCLKVWNLHTIISKNNE